MTIARYWRENASRYNMIAVKCGNCGRVHFPPRTVCPICHRKSIGKMERTKLSGEGEVLTYSVVHEAPSDLEMQKPYVIAMIQMPEGVRVTGQIDRLRADRCEDRDEGQEHFEEASRGRSLGDHPLWVQVRADGREERVNLRERGRTAPFLLFFSLSFLFCFYH